jgi:murein DD-endopeptidase MepM/ murein hydrolase activator NlpD
MLIDIFKDLYENNKGFKKAIDGIVDVFGMLAGILGQALVPIIEMLGDVFAQLVPQIMPLIVMLVNTLAPILVMLVKMLARALMPVIMILARVIATVLPIIIEAFMPILEAVIPIIGMLVKTLARILIPVIMALMPIILELLDVFLSVFMPILDIIVPIIQFLANLLSRVLVGALKILLPIVQWVMNRIVDLVTIGLSIFKWAWRNLVKPALGWFKDGIEAVVGWVEGVVDGIGDAWEGIKEAFAGPINWVKKQINKWLIDPLNTIISAFGGDKIARLKIEGTSVGVRGGSGFTRYADGGPVIGPGGPRDDKINAKLSNGEYVLNHRMVKQAGGFTALERWRGGQGGPADLWNKVLDFVSTPVKWLKDTMVGSINGMIENIVKPGMKLLPDNFVGNFIRGMINGALGAVSDRGKEVDKAQAPVYAGRNAPPYKGPPGGWTFPTGYTGYTTYPSGSHLYAGAIDIPVAAGTAVRAVSVGRITRAGSGPHWTYGNVVFISHANGLESRYAHLRRPVGRVGSIVRTGQIIGISGGVPGEPGAGRTTGAHLHFELNPNRYGYPAGAAKMLRSLGARFATGGVVKPTAGGLMALLGEAGKHERVEPLDRDGLSVRDRAIIEKLAGQYGGGNTVVRVYIGDQELTDIVRTEIVDASERTARQISVGRRR